MAERPLLVLLVGLPASGKSTYALAHGLPVLSSDHLRELLLDDIHSQAYNRLIFATLRDLLRRRLALRRPVTAIDSTHLTPRERRPYLAMGMLHDCRVEAVHFDVPLEVCLARNAARSRVVPEAAIRLMVERFVPPTCGEGFARVTVVREHATAAAPSPTAPPGPAQAGQ